MSTYYERKILEALENNIITLEEARKVLSDTDIMPPIIWIDSPEMEERREILKKTGIDFPEIKWTDGKE